MVLSGFFSRGKLPPQKLWVISGPSSCGKSTFIDSPRCQEVTGLGPATKVVTAGSFKARKINQPYLLHYNILWPYIKTPEMPYNFANEKNWKNICSSGHQLFAVVIRASEEVLAQRVNERKIVERKTITGKMERSYNRQKWVDIYKKVDLEVLYEKWIAELKHHKIPYITINGDNTEYKIIDTYGNL